MFSKILVTTHSFITSKSIKFLTNLSTSLKGGTHAFIYYFDVDRVKKQFFELLRLKRLNCHEMDEEKMHLKMLISSNAQTICSNCHYIYL